jgi:DNA-binding response OmpR family regulator
MVELRNASGAAFLRKFTPTVQAALNEAEFLRLLLRGGERRITRGGLKPFALVIEENRYDCEALIEALKTSGMRAFGCRSGAEGVCVAREITPDLIVMNDALSDIGGMDVCRMLREGDVTAGIPIIVLTGNPDRLYAEGCIADAVLTKPCPTDTLAAAARLFVRHLTGQEGSAG